MNIIQGTPEWVEWRSKGIGASEVAAILGVSPYETPYGVWLVKTGRSKGFEGNSFTQHGQETEAKARARYELIAMEDMLPAIATHPKFEVCRVSLDGRRADGKLILEIKCPRGRQVIDDAKNGVVTAHYVPQVQYQLAVTGADLLHFFVYHEETGEHALVEVKPDIKYQGRIVAETLKFWEKHVLADIPPALTPKDAKVMNDHKEIKELCATLLELKEIGDKTKSDALKAKVIKIGKHSKIRCGNVLISLTQKNGRPQYRMTVSGGE